MLSDPFAAAQLSRRHIGRTVALVSDPTQVGRVTIDLRREYARPPAAHVLVYVLGTDRGLVDPITGWHTVDELVEA